MNHIIDRIQRNQKKDEEYYEDRLCFKSQENPVGCMDTNLNDPLIVNCIMRKLIKDCIDANISFVIFKALAKMVIDNYPEIYMTGSYSREATLEYMESEIMKCKEMSVDRKFALLKFFHEWCGYEYTLENNK